MTTVAAAGAGDGGLFPPDLLSLRIVLPPAASPLTRAALSSLEADRDGYLARKEEGPPGLLALTLRALALGYHFTPALSTVWLAALSPGFRERTWYSWVGRCIARSGPAFIKWGQWASTRSDMFPDALCDALTSLHADAPSHRWAYTQRSVERSLCIPPGTLLDVFESFETSPVASGSIAQVHRAVLKPDACGEEGGGEDGDGDGDSGVSGREGTLVAVKVRHPRVSKLIGMDFRLMTAAADLADRIPALRWLGLRSSVEQFSHTMAAQAHLNVEAHHLEVLNHNFRGWRDVGFPMPFFAGASVIMVS